MVELQEFESIEDEVFVDLINKQFEIGGHDMDHDRLLSTGIGKDQGDPKKEWSYVYTLTEEQYNEFQDWAVDYISKKLHKSKSRARTELMWFTFSYGLRTTHHMFKEEEE